MIERKLSFPRVISCLLIPQNAFPLSRMLRTVARSICVLLNLIYVYTRHAAVSFRKNYRVCPRGIQTFVSHQRRERKRRERKRRAHTHPPRRAPEVLDFEVEALRLYCAVLVRLELRACKGTHEKNLHVEIVCAPPPTLNQTSLKPLNIIWRSQNCLKETTRSVFKTWTTYGQKKPLPQACGPGGRLTTEPKTPTM